VIPARAITYWSAGAPWPTRTQVEQDLLLSRLICEIANDAYLGQELVSEEEPASTSSTFTRRAATAKTSTTSDPLVAESKNSPLPSSISAKRSASRSRPESEPTRRPT
jgi:hypothetical protein